MPIARPLPGIDAGLVRREVLPNGLTVLVREDRSAPVVAIVTYVKAGYFDETDDVAGIAHVLEHMFFKGTERLGVGEIARRTKAIGGYLNAHTIYDHTSYYTVLPSASFERGLDVQFDAYANSVIDAAELGRELEVIIEEAKRKSDNPSAVATETLYELLHDRHRMRRWRIGREPGLRALDRDAVVGFYRNFYRPSNTIVVIAGDVDAGQALAAVRERHGALEAGEPRRTPGEAEPPHARPDLRVRDWSGDIGQAQLAFGWRTVPSLHDDAAPLDLAAAVLGAGRGSRLYQAVRDRRLASSVSAYNYQPTELGVFVVHVEAPPATAGAALDAAWAEVRRLHDAGVPAAELERARRLLEARTVRRLESMEGQANHLAEWEALGGLDLADRYMERLLGATPDEVHAAVRRHLDPELAGVVVYRPESLAPLAASPEALRARLAAARPADLPAVDLEPPAVVVPGRVRFEREEAGVRVYRTEAGVPVLVRHKPGAQVAYVGLQLAGGVTEEGERESGLTNLMTRTALKGTARRSARRIAEDAELLGGGVGSSAGAESFGWSISVPTRHLPAALELLADVVQEPSFPDDAFETERALAVADLTALRDDMFRYPMRLLLGAAFPAHPYGRGALGTEQSLAQLTADDARRWHASRALLAHGAIGVVGDMDPDEAAALAAAAFGRLGTRERPEPSAPAWPVGAPEAADRRDKAQTALAIAFPGPSRRDPTRHAAGLVSGIASGLGGRFFDELRDRQSLAYTVHAFSSELRHAGVFAAYIATSPGKEAAAREGLLREFARLRDEPVTAEELERAQTYAIGVHAIRQEGGGAQLGDMLDAFLVGEGLAELADHDAHVLGVTRDDLQAFARRWFDERRMVSGVVRGRSDD